YYFNIPAHAGLLYSHRQILLADPSQFDTLLQTTNQSAIFKMVNPIQLAQCPATSLPVITLDSRGYVSLYDQKDQECSDMHFFTWNTISGEEKMQSAQTGQFLLQKLKP